MRAGRSLLAAALLLTAAGRARADAGSDWQQIESMDANPPSQDWTTREEAQAGTLEYLGKQEEALREFIENYPDDVHAPDAKLRLAHLLATRADMQQDDRQRQQSDALLDELEAEPAMRGRRADVEFARISIFMQRVDSITGANRDALLEKARGFAKQFPDDRRVAPLLAEVASGFEDAPDTARGLLEQARPVAKTDDLKARIDDDLKRIAMLGKPVEMKWTSVQGDRIDLKQLREKVVLVYFFASWSAPSMLELDWVKQLPGNSDLVQTLGVCLDPDPVAAPSMLADHGVTWPVLCDGRGWQGELVRSLGINSLPTLWILDKQGVLRSLNAKLDAPDLIQKLAREADE